MTIKATVEMVNAVRAHVPAPCSVEQARKVVEYVLTAAQAQHDAAMEDAYQRGRVEFAKEIKGVMKSYGRWPRGRKA